MTYLPEGLMFPMFHCSYCVLFEVLFLASVRALALAAVPGTVNWHHILAGVSTPSAYGIVSFGEGLPTNMYASGAWDLKH